jgi:hypothetical protein
MTTTTTSGAKSPWRAEAGGYCRTLADGSTLSVRPSAGRWRWSIVSGGGRAARYGRPHFRRLSQALAAADQAAAAVDGSGQYDPFKSS